MHRLRLSSAVLAAVLTLSACGSSEGQPGDDAGSTPSAPESAATSSESATAAPNDPSPSPQKSTVPTVEVRIIGDRVTPNAEQLELTSGETMRFEIVSDRAGELHVHSKPEQYVEFGEGRTREEISVDTPGSVQVEEHDTSVVVAVLEVR